MTDMKIQANKNGLKILDDVHIGVDSGPSSAA